MRTSEMAKVLATAFLAWPTFTITEPMARLWCSSFPGFSVDEFWEGMRAALKTHTGNFPPTIGQVSAAMERLHSVNELTDGEVWALLQSAVRQFGRPSPARARKFLRERGGDRLVDTVRALGWNDICAWRTDDEVANRAHFWRVYNDFRARDRFSYHVQTPPTAVLDFNVKKLLEELN